MRKLIIAMQKGRNVISIFLFITLLSFNAASQQQDRYVKCTNELIDDIIVNFSKHSKCLVVNKHTESLEWKKYLSLEYFNKYNWGLTEFAIPTDLGLTAEDISFMKETVINQQLYKWSYSNLDSRNFFSKKGKRKSKKEGLNYTYCSFSSPLFNKDYSIAVIFVNKICGIECGYEKIEFYKFSVEADEWIMYAYIPLSVS